MELDQLELEAVRVVSVAAAVILERHAVPSWPILHGMIDIITPEGGAPTWNR